nr:MAG TPA: hypothetical protein [Caudoviricetes sp.]
MVFSQLAAASLKLETDMTRIMYSSTSRTAVLMDFHTSVA